MGSRGRLVGRCHTHYIVGEPKRVHSMMYLGLAYIRELCEPRDMSKSFGEFVRDQRRQCGLTQREVAEALGLRSIAFLSDIEAGNRKPAPESLPALARVLKTDVELLRSHDIRSPLAEVRTLLEAHPEYAVAFRRVVEHSKELGADEVLRRIEHSTDGSARRDLPANSDNQRKGTPHTPRRKEPPPGEGTLPL